MPKQIIKCWLGLILLSALWGCGKPIDKSELPGTYVADSNFATDTVLIKDNGEFLQSVTVKAGGKVAVAHGKWHFNQADQDIVFDENFMEVVNGFGEMVTDFARPIKRAVSILPVRRVFGNLQIGVDPTTPYRKQPSP